MDELEDLIRFFEEEDSTIWEIEGALDNEADREILKPVFNEKQQRVLRAIINKLLEILEWHDKKDDESHNDIRKQIERLEEEFRHHRHDFSKSYTSRPEV